MREKEERGDHRVCCRGKGHVEGMKRDWGGRRRARQRKGKGKWMRKEMLENGKNVEVIYRMEGEACREVQQKKGRSYEKRKGRARKDEGEEMEEGRGGKEWERQGNWMMERKKGEGSS